MAGRIDKSGQIAFIASPTPEARKAQKRLARLYGSVPPEAADIIVALGGDGLMLQTLHAFMNTGKPIYGMNCGSVGFLMNEFEAKGLRERLAAAVTTAVHPLAMRAVDADGGRHKAYAINEVSLLRQSYQAAKLKITIDGHVRMAELICDGLLVATPAGSSTAMTNTDCGSLPTRTVPYLGAARYSGSLFTASGRAAARETRMG